MKVQLRRHSAVFCMIGCVVVSALWLLKLTQSTQVLPIARLYADMTGQLPTWAPGAAPTFSYGDTLHQSQLAALRRGVGANALWFLIAIVAPGPDGPSITEYYRTLGRRYAQAGLRVHVVDTPVHDTDRVLQALGISRTGAATVLVKGDGSVTYYSRRALRQDVARLLIERNVARQTNEEWPAVPTDPDVWTARLASNTYNVVTETGEARASLHTLLNSEYLVLFDAHCSTCVVSDQIEDLETFARIARAKRPSVRIAAVFPWHYRTALQLHTTRLRGQVTVLLADSTLAPEVAYVTRGTARAARPVVLLQQASAVVRVGRLGYTDSSRRDVGVASRSDHGPAANAPIPQR